MTFGAETLMEREKLPARAAPAPSNTTDRAVENATNLLTGDLRRRGTRCVRRSLFPNVRTLNRAPGAATAHADAPARPERSQTFEGRPSSASPAAAEGARRNIVALPAAGAAAFTG